MKKHHLAILVVYSFVLAFVLLLHDASSSQAGTQESADKTAYQNFRKAEPILEEAKLFYARHNLDAAKKKTEACLRLLPEHSEAHFLAAQIAYQEGWWDLALEHMEQAEKDFGFIAGFRARSRRDQMLELQRQKITLENYISAIEDYLNINGENMRPTDVAVYQKAIAESRQKLAIVASRLAEAGEANLTPPADYRYFHGNILYRLGRFPEAEQKYLAAIKTDPRHSAAVNNLVLLYFTTRRYREAAQIIDQAEKLNLQVNDQLKRDVFRALGRN